MGELILPGTALHHDDRDDDKDYKTDFDQFLRKGLNHCLYILSLCLPSPCNKNPEIDLNSSEEDIMIYQYYLKKSYISKNNIFRADNFCFL